MSAVMFTWCLRDTLKPVEAISFGIDSLLPGWLASSADANSCPTIRRSIVPQRSTLQLAQLSLDIALMLVRRAEIVGQTVARYGWADSSTVAKGDWLIAKYLVISCDNMVATARASQDLTRGGFDIDVRQRMGRELLDSMRVYTQPPMSMASGRTALEHKVLERTPDEPEKPSSCYGPLRAC